MFTKLTLDCVMFYQHILLYPKLPCTVVVSARSIFLYQLSERHRRVGRRWEGWGCGRGPDRTLHHPGKERQVHCFGVVHDTRGEGGKKEGRREGGW